MTKTMTMQRWPVHTEPAEDDGNDDAENAAADEEQQPHEERQPPEQFREERPRRDDGCSWVDSVFRWDLRMEIE